MNFIVRFIAFLGHGRALETYLGLLKILIALWLVTTDIDIRTPAFSDLAWWYSSYVLAAPIFLIGLTQLGGLAMNVSGWECSWAPRAVAAGGGVFLWLWMAWKTAFLGIAASWLMPLAIVSILANVFLLWKAWNRLPVPGAAGLV